VALKRLSLRGFTLLEMLVTLGIMGILLALGVPAYQRHIYRARQYEAQVSLGQVYMSEKGFYADLGTYTSCLAAIGVKAENPVRFYIFGFGSGDSDVLCGPKAASPDNNLQSCNGYKYDRDGTVTTSCASGAGSTFFVATTVSVAGDTVPSSSGILGSNSDPGKPAYNTFTGMAVGYISQEGVTDSWRIDENKRLVNFAPGI
jgi:type IV pilus assembly protein PilA